MVNWGKLGHKFRAIGSKVAGAASFIGHKVGRGLLTLALAVTALNPALGAGFAAAGGVAEGIGAIGDVGKRILAGNLGAAELKAGKAGVQAVGQGLRGLRSAYGDIRGSALERPPG